MEIKEVFLFFSHGPIPEAILGLRACPATILPLGFCGQVHPSRPPAELKGDVIDGQQHPNDQSGRSTGDP